MITVAQLEQIVSETGIPLFYLIPWGGVYSEPDLDWIDGEFSDSLRRNLESLGLDQYEDEANNCNKFSRIAWAFATIEHARTTGHPQSSLSFGMMAYTKDTGGRHAINWGISDGKAFFYDPQTQSRVQLSQSEIESCDFAII